MIDQTRGMTHFLLSQVIEMFVQPAVAPMFAQGRMQKILVHRRELTHQHFVQNIENALFRFHAYSHSHAGPALT